MNDRELLENIFDHFEKQRSATLVLYRDLQEARQELEAWKAATGYPSAEEFVKNTYEVENETQSQHHDRSSQL